MYYTQNIKTNFKLGYSWALEHLGILRVFDLNVNLNVANVVTNPVVLFFSQNMMLKDWQIITKWKSKRG